MFGSGRKRRGVCAISGAAVMIAASPAIAHDGQMRTACAAGGDMRTVSIVAPGLVGAACDVSYRQDGGAYESIPFHADGAAEACIEEAARIVHRLRDEGFDCAGALLAVDLNESTGDTSAATIAAGGTAVEAMNATAGPVHLLSSLTPVSVEASRTPRRRYADVSGAPVEDLAAEPAGAAGVVEASAPEGPAIETLAGGPEPAVDLRPAADIVKDVILSQAAAWNEGDLDAFMAGYWKSDELAYVSDGTVRNGWDATLSHYRKTYSSGSAAMGRLSFDAIEVAFIEDGVAAADGRYRLTRQGETATGAFTLVMRQIDGRWLIVEDRTTSD